MGIIVNEEMHRTATICLTRLRTYVDSLRAYNVFIDGIDAGRIRQGTAQTYNVQPGHHTVILRVDWLRSPDISVDCAADDVVRLVCSGQPQLLQAFIAGYSTPHWYIILQRES